MNHDMMSNLWKKDRTNEAIKTERIVDEDGRVKQSFAALKQSIGGDGAAAEGEDIDLDLSTTGEETKIELGSEDDGESKDMVLGSITIGTDDAAQKQEVKIETRELLENCKEMGYTQQVRSLPTETRDHGCIDGYPWELHNEIHSPSPLPAHRTRRRWNPSVGAARSRVVEAG